MTRDTVVAFRVPEGFSPDPLTDLLRHGARHLIAQAVGAELRGFLAARADQTDVAGHKKFGPARPSARTGGSDRYRRGSNEGAPGKGTCAGGRAAEVQLGCPAAPVCDAQS